MRYAARPATVGLCNTGEPTMRISNVKRLLLASVMALSGPAWAEDIDLFLGVPPSATNAPNVLIILDNTANWNTPFAKPYSASMADPVSANFTGCCSAPSASSIRRSCS